MFICIEGVDGSGKTTLAKALADKMSARYIKMPYYDSDSVTAPVIKDILSGERRISSIIRRKLFGLNRYESFIGDWGELTRTDDIIMDRYTLSEMVYQPVLFGDVVQDIFDFEFSPQGLNMPLPDITIVLTGDSKVFEERRTKRNGATDIYERDSVYLENVNRHYQDIGLMPVCTRSINGMLMPLTIGEVFNIYYVNAEKDPDEILKEVESLI